MKSNNLKRCNFYDKKQKHFCLQCLANLAIFRLLKTHAVRAQDVSELPSTGQEEERTGLVRVLHSRVKVVLDLGPRFRHHRGSLVSLHL
jgi:hypothetical protein